MRSPEDFPADIMQKARDIGSGYMSGQLLREIREALLAERLSATERERAACAEIADVVSDEKDVMALESNDNTDIAAYREGERTATRIAAAIRSQP